MKKTWYLFKHLQFDHLGNPIVPQIDISDPNYYDPKKHTWVADLEKEVPIIKAEIESLLNKEGKSMQAYFQSSMVEGKGKWRSIAFLVWGIQRPKYAKQCPQTMEILKRIPGLTSASISLLEPHTQIKGHHGDTNGIMRCHLGLSIPRGLPECGFEVNGEKRAWENGQLLMFCDAKFHRAWNDSDENRFIMIIDVVKKEFLKDKRKICFKVSAILGLLKLYEVLPFSKKLHPFFQKLLF